MKTQGDASRTSGLSPRLGDTRAPLSEVPRQRLAAVPALPAPSLRSQSPCARGFRLPLRWGSRRVRPAEPPRGTHRAEEVQRRRKSPCGSRSAPPPTRLGAPLRGGVEGAPPQPAETAVQGGTRAPRSALEERRRYKSSAPAPAPQWLCSPRGAPLPCSPTPAHACTHFWAAKDGGRPGSRSSAPGSESAPGASSQPRLGGPPLGDNSDLGKRWACRLPDTKGKRESVRGSVARALSLALLFWKRALC